MPLRPAFVPARVAVLRAAAAPAFTASAATIRARGRRFLIATCALAVALLAGPPLGSADTVSWTTGESPSCVFQFAADGSGNVYVPVYDAGSSDYVVKQYTGTGAYLRTVGEHRPTALAGSPDGGVYISYSNVSYHTIIKYDSAGHALSWITRQFGVDPGQVSSILSIGADADGNVYVLDDGKSWMGGPDRVEKFYANGAFVTEWRSTDHGDGQFDLSDRGSLAVARDGTVYVADSDNRIQKFTTDGTFVTSWGSAGSGPGRFTRLSGITTDAAGRVYAADAGAPPGDPVQEFDSSGAFLGASGSSSHLQIAALATYGDGIVYGEGCQTVARFERTVPDVSPLSLSADWRSISMSEMIVQAGRPVTATVSASVPFGAVGTYAFAFGDGTPQVSGASPTAVHTYTAAGQYQVTARVTSTAGGSATTTQQITVVSPPVNTGPPAITGTALEGQRLLAHHGTWNNGPSRYGYGWQRCDRAGKNCVSLIRAFSQEYVLSAADVGRTIRVAETASNSIGTSKPAVSQQTQVVKPLPKVSALSVSPGRFRAIQTRSSVTTAPRVGTEVRYKLTTAARVRFTIERALDGRQAKGRCVAPSLKNRAARRCTRYLALRGGFTVTARAGTNRIRFTGSLGGAKLPPGTYRLTAVPTGAARPAGPTTATFTIVR